MAPQAQPHAPQRSRARPFTVSEVLGQVRSCLEDHFLPVLVRAEVSDLRRPRSGHWYFSLRDPRARLRVVAFADLVVRLPEEVRELCDGTEALVWGRISAYPASGDVQLIAEGIELAGRGARWAQRERLKKALQREGVFGRRRPLPGHPRRIALVTSPTGSAIHDVCTTIERRYPAAAVVLVPSRVNGVSSAPEIAHAIRRADAAGCDLLLVVRGGGSAEDLAAFDEESVVRAIAGCATPVVTGIGHEDDVTLAELAADRRAPTPTGAAEVAVPAREALLRDLDARERRLRQALARRLDQATACLDQAERRLRGLSPQARLERQADLLTASAQRLQRAIATQLAQREQRLLAAARTLASLSPLQVLARGYSLTTTTEGTLVQDVATLRPGDEVHTRLTRGSFRAQILTVEDPE